MPKKEQEIYKKALELWGEQFQIMMAIEEMAELMQKLSQYYRQNRIVSQDDVLKEIADVEILLNQLKLIFDDEDYQSFRFIKQEKLNKLINYLENAKERT